MLAPATLTGYLELSGTFEARVVLQPVVASMFGYKCLKLIIALAGLVALATHDGGFCQTHHAL